MRDYVADYVKRTPYDWNKETGEFVKLTKKVLDVRIPKGTSDLLQLRKIEDYANEKGIILKIKEM